MPKSSGQRDANGRRHTQEGRRSQVTRGNLQEIHQPARQRFVKAWWRWNTAPGQRETSHDLGGRAEGARMPKQIVSRQTQQAQNEERGALREQRIEKILEAQQSEIQELTTHVSQMIEKIMQTVSEIMERVTRAESRNASHALEQERQERSVSGHAKRGAESRTAGPRSCLRDRGSALARPLAGAEGG